MDDRINAGPQAYGHATLRHVQWLLSLFSYVLFDRAFNHVRTSLAMDGGVRAIPAMNAATLAYSTAILLGVYLARRLPIARRYSLEMISVPIDIFVAILFLAKGAILNSTRLDCQVLLKEKFFEDGLNHQTLKTFSKSAFGSGRLGIDDIDRQCAASMIIYWLSHIAIISYSFSILLTVLKLREIRKILQLNKKGSALGHVEMVVEMQASVAERLSSTSSFRSPGFSNERARSQERLQIQDFGIPITYRTRSSQETTSSYNAEAMLVCDGFQRPDEPPAYVSRPTSLYSFKGD